MSRTRVYNEGVFNLGLYTYGVIVVAGLVMGMYFFWKLGREEHWGEISLFDAFFLSYLAYLVIGRGVYTALNWTELGGMNKALALITHPGLEVEWGLVGAGLVYLLVAGLKQWDKWKAMDVAVVPLSLILAVGHLAGLVNDLANWQVRGVGLIWGVVTFGMIARIKKNFRFYEWYKGQMSVARDGLAAMVFMAMAGGYLLGQSILEWPDYPILMLGIALLAGGIYGIIFRSGRQLQVGRRR